MIKKMYVQDKEVRENAMRIFGNMNDYYDFCRTWCIVTSARNKDSVNKKSLKRWGIEDARKKVAEANDWNRSHDQKVDAYK